MITLTPQEKELVLEAIDVYVETLRDDCDPHNDNLADQLEAAAVKIGA